jgi:hypothetical protein
MKLIKMMNASQAGNDLDGGFNSLFKGVGHMTTAST